MIKIQCWTLNDFQAFEVDYPETAIKIIRRFKKKGYMVEWSCIDPEDNEILWEKC